MPPGEGKGLAQDTWGGRMEQGGIRSEPSVSRLGIRNGKQKRTKTRTETKKGKARTETAET